MIIVWIRGGLGNQMFQYALARNLEFKTYFEVKLDITNYEKYTGESKYYRGYDLERLNIKNTNYATKNEVKRMKPANIFEFYINKIFGNKKLVTEHQGRVFQKDIFNIKDGVYIAGFWQSEKYFEDIAEKIRQEFTLKKPIADKKNREIISSMKKNQSVSIHIRRGDFNPSIMLQINYYIEAINLITSKIENPFFFVFSDDIKWAKSNLKTNSQIEYIDWNKGEESYKDMFLMKECDHNIISNSTFSWWGAWLNSNPDKVVISPKSEVWGKGSANDLLPKKWVTI